MPPRLWPASLFGRVALILFLGLAAAHALSFWLVLMERGGATRGMMVAYLASDVASSVAMLDRLPPAERAAWLPRLQRRNYGFVLDAPPGAPPRQSSPLAEPVLHALAAALPSREVTAVQPPASGIALRLRTLLADGTPLAVDVLEPRLDVSPWVFGVLAAQLALLAALSGWAVRLATRPLQQLARAADALRPAQAGPPLPEDGPREVAQAARAFNLMGARIAEHLDERMRILAAVSHDLQTPITRLRLRADLLDDAVLRDKLHADLAEMQALVEEGLSYARSAHAAREAEQPVALHALLDSIACDYADAGRPVRLLDSAPASRRTRPQALRRIVCNLVDNALKFAGAAEIALEMQANGSLRILVLDRGPGIPQDQLQAVLQPFHRLETSRSRATGGTGLGLAIAQQLSQAIGARLVLAAREGGGLQAGVELGEDQATT
ncbi:MAG: ATP-binding protein [Pseudomonadota bacterium]